MVLQEPNGGRHESQSRSMVFEGINGGHLELRFRSMVSGDISVAHGERRSRSIGNLSGAVTKLQSVNRFRDAKLLAKSRTKLPSAESQDQLSSRSAKKSHIKSQRAELHAIMGRLGIIGFPAEDDEIVLHPFGTGKDPASCNASPYEISKHLDELPDTILKHIDTFDLEMRIEPISREEAQNTSTGSIFTTRKCLTDFRLYRSLTQMTA